MATTETTVIAAEAARTSYVDWPAIIAGIVLASAISLLLLTFGSAIGLSLTSFRGAETTTPLWVALAATLWLVWVQVSSFMAGGYLTGRLRRPAAGATEHEVDVRDGAHGLLVWAGALVLGAVIAAGGLGAVANAIGGAASTATIAASNAADGDVSFDPNTYFADSLLRSDRPVAAADADANGEIVRIFANAGDEPVASDDRDYLATLVARETGLTEAEAQTRVDQVLQQMETAKAQAAEAAEKARKTAVIGAFLAAAVLLISAAGAYWAASMGGRHRDQGTVFATVFRRYP